MAVYLRAHETFSLSSATLPPIFWNSLFMGRKWWQQGGSRWQQNDKKSKKRCEKATKKHKKDGKNGISYTASGIVS
jgi:hypothetical protein